MPQHTPRFQSLPQYLLATIPQRKRELIAKGVDVIDLGAGDADLSPPKAAIDELRKALDEPTIHRYGFGLGYAPFREAAAAWMQKRFGVSFNPMTELVPLIGSKEGISHLAFAYVGKGDIALIPDPGYLAYLGGTLLSEGTAHEFPLRPENKFLIDLDAIPADVARRAKILYVNYPNNPTAATAPNEYLAQVVKWSAKNDVLLVYDNAYSELAFDGYVPPSIFQIDGARDVAIEFHSLSKTYNMTGWRCGWAVAKPEIAGTLAKVKSFVDTGQFMAIQRAGVAALNAWSEFVPQNVATFKARRDAAVAAFRANGFACEPPRATMYLWLPLPAGVPSTAFHERLIDEEGVIVLPGRGLGAGGEGFFRVSFITSPERITEAAVRAGKVLRRMQGKTVAA
ncbi:MAG TPA: aminotransferase class I/II-fold pyridoxal phosphate-dependent enzyme [Gemmatimonadaceae bacterium]|nr:aminotransferase class I/II-fold pyridoxal phosphate-dependent enzyme [Gemmatimonadaceae bacterium]